MRGNHSRNSVGASSTIAALAAALAMGAAAMTGSMTAAAEEIQSSIVRGGLLYDNWMKVVGEPAPAKSHPAYPGEGEFADDPGENWRCKECHGWDYRGVEGAYSQGEHRTGIKGISDMMGGDAAEILSILRDDTHLYGMRLYDDELDDLAVFVSRGQVDMDAYIDPTTGRAKGDASGLEPFYVTICSNCHGVDGRGLLNSTHLGKVANDNPWEALHKLLHGHPGEDMPALRVLGTELLSGLLAYLQNLPTEDELLASIGRGGRLYDNWFKEKDVQAPRESHPAYPAGKRETINPEATWRCKECHGWDYKGKDGAYSSGKHYTGIKGVQGMAGADSKAIVEVLKDGNHGYLDQGSRSRTASGRGRAEFPDAIIAVIGERTHKYLRGGPGGGLLDERDLLDLANFISQGQIDMTGYIDPATGKARGDRTKQEAFYHTICASCHGADGKKVNAMLPLGKVAVGNPWEALHKIVNGHPAGKMPALRVLDMPMLVDVLAYIQTLPEE